MKATGIVRNLDPLGRICLPKETRKALNIKDGDSIEIYTDGGDIVLRKYIPGCHCCNETEGLIEVMGLKLCPKCLDEFNNFRKMVDELR